MRNPVKRGAESWASAETAISNSRRWGIVALLFAASMINYLDRATISVALPLISVSLNLSRRDQGPAAFRLFLLLRADAGAGRLVRRSVQSALDLLRPVCLMVVSLRPHGICGKLGRPDSFPRSSWDWRVRSTFQGGQRSSVFCLSPRSGASPPESLTAARALGLPLGRRSSPGSSSSSAGGRCSSWWASQRSSGSFPGGWSFPHGSPRQTKAGRPPIIGSFLGCSKASSQPQPDRYLSGLFLF